MGGDVMTTTNIVMDIGAQSHGDAINRTRYALCNQVSSLAPEIASNHGPLALTKDERADLCLFLEKMLKRRLAVLEAVL